MHADLKLGELIQGEQNRDCIHIAVAPVVAGEKLLVGQRVGLNAAGEAVSGGFPRVGIVDPFLTEAVPKGAKFWLFLLPNTVTGMRHHWQHPAFGESFDARDKTPEMHASEKWLRVYAIRFNTYDDADEAFTNLIEGLKSGDLHCHGQDLYSLDDLESADELRHHAETYLGIRINWSGFTFSCGC